MGPNVPCIRTGANAWLAALPEGLEIVYRRVLGLARCLPGSSWPSSMRTFSSDPSRETWGSDIVSARVTE